MSEQDAIEDLTQDIRRLLLTAFKRGYRAGGEAVRNSLIKAAEAPLGDSPYDVDVEPFLGRTVKSSALHNTPSSHGFQASWALHPSTPSRAPRGLTSQAITDVLATEPGLSIGEIEERVNAKYPEIARKTIGNELRRQEGSLYERADKYSWFLMGQAQKKTPAGDTAGASGLELLDESGGFNFKPAASNPA